MILGLAGHAGAGKDSVAGIIKEIVPNTVCLSQAAPLKELGKVFNFTHEQLWGPSGKRNEAVLSWNMDGLWAVFLKEKAGEILDWLEECGLDVSEGVYSKSMILFTDWVMDLKNQVVKEQRGMSARTFLQQLGTEFGRKLNENIWNDIAINRATKLLKSKEADLVVITDVRFRSEIIGIKNTGIGKVVLIKDTFKSTLEGANAKHASEAELDSVPFFWFDDIVENEKKNGLDGLKSNITWGLLTSLKLIKYDLRKMPLYLGRAE